MKDGNINMQNRIQTIKYGLNNLFMPRQRIRLFIFYDKLYVGYVHSQVCDIDDIRLMQSKQVYL